MPDEPPTPPACELGCRHSTASCRSHFPQRLYSLGTRLPNSLRCYPPAVSPASYLYLTSSMGRLATVPVLAHASPGCATSRHRASPCCQLNYFHSGVSISVLMGYPSGKPLQRVSFLLGSSRNRYPRRQKTCPKRTVLCGGSSTDEDVTVRVVFKNSSFTFTCVFATSYLKHYMMGLNHPF